MKRTIIALCLLVGMAQAQTIHTRLTFISATEVAVTNLQQVPTAYQVTGVLTLTTGTVGAAATDTLHLPSCGIVHVAPLNMLTCIEILATCSLPVALQQVARQTGTNIYYEATEGHKRYRVRYSDGSIEVVEPVLQRKGASYYFNYTVKP